MRGFSAVLGLVLLASHALAQNAAPRHINPSAFWTGTLTAANVKNVPGGVITNANDFARLWQRAKPDMPVPTVDFRTQFVIVHVYTGWSEVQALWITLDANGNARIGDLTQPQRIPGSFGIGVFARQGVKTIDGQALGN